MELKKRKEQNLWAFILHKMWKKIITGGREMEETERERGWGGKRRQDQVLEGTGEK